MMKRIGRVASIEGNRREMFKIEAEELDVELEESGGIYVPFSRKDLIFAMRSSDEADGDSRIIGSGRLAGALGL